MAFAARCPICHGPVVWEDNSSRPFCGERCRLIDLGGWISERYRVPAEGADDEDGLEGSEESDPE